MDGPNVEYSRYKGEEDDRGESMVRSFSIDGKLPSYWSHNHTWRIFSGLPSCWSPAHVLALRPKTQRMFHHIRARGLCLYDTRDAHFISS
jgi:hypothetical protein